MSRGFSLAQLNPKNRTDRTNRAPRRHLRIAAVAAPLATAAVIGVGLAGTAAPDAGLPGLAGADLSGDAAAASRAAGAAAISQTAISSAERSASISRSFDRVAIPEVTGELWTTRELKLRLTPAENARSDGDFESVKRIPVTGNERGAYTQVVLGKKVYWVTSEYLSEKKPKPTPETMGLSAASCPDGSSIESSLQPAAVKVYRATCAAFPELTSYGGQDGHGEHVNGEAIDFMVPSHEVGERVKDFLYAHRAELDLFDIIWAQQIWTIERSGEGFRGMSDRGSSTANHFDHVHIKIN